MKKITTLLLATVLSVLMLSLSVSAVWEGRSYLSRYNVRYNQLQAIAPQIGFYDRSDAMEIKLTGSAVADNELQEICGRIDTLSITRLAGNNGGLTAKGMLTKTDGRKNIRKIIDGSNRPLYFETSVNTFSKNGMGTFRKGDYVCGTLDKAQITFDSKDPSRVGWASANFKGFGNRAPEYSTGVVRNLELVYDRECNKASFGC